MQVLIKNSSKFVSEIERDQKDDDDVNTETSVMLEG